MWTARPAAAKRTVRARPRPGMLTQRGCSHPFAQRGCCCCREGVKEDTIATGPVLPGATAALPHPPPERGSVKARELPTRGKWAQEEELGDRGAARAAHTQTGKNLFCPRSRCSRERYAGPSSASLTQQPQILRAPRGSAAGGPRARSTWNARREGVDAPEHARAPHLQRSTSPGPGAAGAQSRARVGGGGGSAGRARRTPAAAAALAGAAPRRTAAPLPSVTRRLPQHGRAPGADPVHVGRRARSRPAPSSAPLAAHGRRRRAPEAGGDRLQPV